MVKVLFICHGNICRSPMAEYLLKEMVRQQGLAAQFQIASAATSREEIGNDVYPPARAELRAHGIPVGHRAAVHAGAGWARAFLFSPANVIDETGRSG